MTPRRAARAPAGLLAVTLAGCLGGVRQDPGTPDDCPAVAAAPVPATLAPLLEGDFELILIATDSVSATPAVERVGSGAAAPAPAATGAPAARSAVGRLVLRGADSPPPPSDSPLAGPPPAYVGWAEIDLAGVGATAAGSPGERDPAAPGAAAYLLDPGETVRVVVRLGAEANRRDRVRFDGAHTTLTAGSIAPTGFAGSWASAGGPGGVSGHFCARRR